MSDVQSILDEANNIDGTVTFTEEACEGLTAIPAMFRGMALKNIVKQAKERGIDVVDKAFVDLINEERGA